MIKHFLTPFLISHYYALAHARANVPTTNTNRKLWIKVLDQDVGRDDCLGKGHVDLEDFKPTSELKEIDIRVDNNIIKRDAVIYLKIKYEK